MAENRNKELFENMPVPQAVRKMVVPTIIGQMIVLLYNMADTFFLGKTNDPRIVAGAALILPVFNISLALANLAGTGGGSLVSRLLGHGDPDEARRSASFSIYLTIFLGAVFSLCILVFMKPLLTLLGAGPDTFDYAASYAFFVLGCGAIPTILSNVLASMLRSIGESAKASFGITLGGVLNIILDPVFMFLVFPKGKEITAVATATLISNCTSCCFFLIMIYSLGKQSVLRLGRPNDLPDISSIKSLFAVGLPASLAVFLFDIDYIIIDRLMSGYGDAALAAIGIVLKVERMPLNIGLGISLGMVPIVAYNYSSKNYERMKKIVMYAGAMGVILGVISVALYEGFAPYIIRFFIGDAETVYLGTNFLRIRSLATVLMYLCFFHVYLFNAFGKGNTALFLGVMRWAVFNIPMLFLMEHLFGMYGIPWAQITADVMVVILSVVVYQRFLRKSLK